MTRRTRAGCARGDAGKAVSASGKGGEWVDDAENWNGRIVIDGTNPVEFPEPGSPGADDPAAKADVRKILEAIGYFAVDLGSLDIGGPLASLPFGPLAATHFARI